MGFADFFQFRSEPQSTRSQQPLQPFAAKASETCSFFHRYFFGGAPVMEFHDQCWFPRLLRDYVTDGLQFILNLARVYRPIVPLLNHAILAAKAESLVDLCSGGGGPWPWLHRFVRNDGGPVQVCLTDRFPNASAFERLHSESGGQVTFYPEAVRAENIPAEVFGFRTVFTSFHHFQPSQARAILQNAVDARQGIGVFEAAKRRPSSILSTLLMLLGGFLSAPFIRPFKVSRLFWTYVIPAIPFVLFFDGVISCLRAYSREELAELVSQLDARGYVWDIGERPGIVAPITYLIGYPLLPHGR
jgi:hypothetical protein